MEAMVQRAPHVVSPRFDDLGFDGKPRRLGIYGGTFDPIHVGHVIAAYAAHRSFDLDAVLFVPAGMPSFKQDTVVASPRQRFEMCDLAAHEYRYPYFDVSDIETRREGVTYTIDTLRALRAHYPENVELVFILGADALLSLLKWRSIDDLKSMAQFVTLSRPGYEIEPSLRDEFQRLGLSIAEMGDMVVEVSSSEVRERLAKGQSVEGYVPRVVLDYIEEHGLYRSVEDGGSDER